MKRLSSEPIQIIVVGMRMHEWSPTREDCKVMWDYLKASGDPNISGAYSPFEGIVVHHFLSSFR
jgi:hypothetical protein